MGIITYDIPRMGYILAYRGDNSFFSNQIVKAQLKAGFSGRDACITHVEVSGGGFDSINIAPPLSELVDIRKENVGRYAYILRYKNDDYEKRGRYKVAYFSATLCNMGYDVMGVLRFIFRWIGQSNRLFFCSEGCAWALRKEYPEVFDGLNNYEVMPAHFMSDYFEIVWGGEIPKYENIGIFKRLNLWKNSLRGKAKLCLA